MTDTMQPAFGLAGQVVVVTGAGGGIGRGIARAMGREKAKVAILDLKEDGIAETRRMIEADGGEAVDVPCDVSDKASIEAAHACIVECFGEADVLVNNAGILRLGTLDTLSLEDWNRVIAVNTTGYFLCSQIFGQAMLERGRGTLVHVCSVASQEPTTKCGAYSVSKAGATMLSHLLASEWGPRGVRSNALHPGLIHTPLTEAVYSDAEKNAKRASAVPLQRVGTPEDIAQVALYLASPLSAYVNGAELMVDGGFSRHLMTLIPRFD